MIDERPEEVKQMEVFRTGNRWKVIGGNWVFFVQISVSITYYVYDEYPLPIADEKEGTDVENENEHQNQKADPSSKKNSSQVKKTRHDSPDISPPRKIRHDSPDLSPPRQRSGKSGKRQI